MSVNIYALTGAPISLLLFLFVGGPAKYIFLVMTGLTVFSPTPVMLAMVQEHAGSSPAAANGLFMMFSFIARSSIVILIGWLADLFGLTTAYTIAALVGVTAIPMICFLPPSSSQKPLPSPNHKM